jgi:WD40 repeat protein
VDGWDKEVTALRYLGGGDAAATTSGDGKVRIIDSNGAQVKLLEGAKDFMNTLSATKSGNVLVAGGEDGVLHVWDVGMGKVMGKFGKE